MTAVEFFPPLNASLNALSGVFLLIAYRHIRHKNIPAHRRFMLWTRERSGAPLDRFPVKVSKIHCD